MCVLCVCVFYYFKGHIHELNLIWIVFWNVETVCWLIDRWHIVGFVFKFDWVQNAKKKQPYQNTRNQSLQWTVRTLYRFESKWPVKSINFAQNIVCNLWKVPVLISYWNHTIHIFWNVSTYFVVVLCVCKTKSGILKMQWTSSSSFFYFPYRKQMTFNSVWKLHGSWICLILTTDFANEL